MTDLFLTTAAQGVTLPNMAAKKNPAAVALGKRRAKKAAKGEMAEIGRIGGLAGGRARADALDAAQRSAIARQAAAARWKK